MTTSADHFDELRTILESICEDRLTAPQAARLDELTLRDAAARRFYLEYIELHGNLYWDAAHADAAGRKAIVDGTCRENDPIVDAIIADAIVADDERSLQASTARAIGRRFWLPAAVAAVAVIATTWALMRPAVVLDQAPLPKTAPAEMADNAGAPPESDPVAPSEKPRQVEAGSPVVANVSLHRSAAERNDAERPAAHGKPVDLRPFITVKPESAEKSAPAPAPGAAAKQTAAEPDDENDGEQPASVVGLIDAGIRKGWRNAGVEPSPIADDAEWLRRVYLDVVGHIPPEEAVNVFLEDDGPQKRSAVVETLLKDSGYPRNWATVWANLLLGRQPRAAGVSREALEKFLRDDFASNVGWNEIVFELVSAEGSAEQNPAANFLLAHLNNEAVPATAMTARLFLGLQVQCGQCHDHPFHPDKQNRFWELNSFFQQTEMVSHGIADAGAQMGAPGEANHHSGEPAAWPALVTRRVGGPMYYETRRGEMRAAFPVYAGQKIDPGPEVNRRRELARLIARGDDRQLARAMVNRMWQHFFGCGFTRPVDDMGSHNPPTHPEVLDRLTKEFVASGYDLKQLIRWICATDGYQRASTLEPSNRQDDPTTGAAPIFSRVYLKPMTAEQLYDSLLVATRAKSSARTDWNDVGRRRQDWVRQFIISYGTDENDESTTLAGTVSQALLMMNDKIVRGALGSEPGTLLFDVLHDAGDDDAKIRRLCRSALSRDPTETEIDAAVGLLRGAREAAPSAGTAAQQKKLREQAESRSLEDIFWAYLNANEFALVH